MSRAIAGTHGRFLNHDQPINDHGIVRHCVHYTVFLYPFFDRNPRHVCHQIEVFTSHFLTSTVLFQHRRGRTG